MHSWTFFCAARQPDSMQGHMYWCAPPETVDSSLRAEAARKKVAPTTWHAVLKEGDQARLHEYDEAMEESRASGHTRPVKRRGARVVPKGCASNSLICNPSQNCGAIMGALTAFVPTLLQNSVVWSQLHQHPLIGREHLFVMGVPAFSREMSGAFEPPWLDKMLELDDSSLKAFAGNMIHSMLAGALSCWVLCCFVPHHVASLATLRPSGSLSRGMSSDFLAGGVHWNDVLKAVQWEQEQQGTKRKRRRLREKSHPDMLNFQH